MSELARELGSEIQRCPSQRTLRIFEFFLRCFHLVGVHARQQLSYLFADSLIITTMHTPILLRFTWGPVVTLLMRSLESSS